MQSFSVGPFALWRSLCVSRGLIFELVKKEIKSKYKASFMGVGWAFMHPLIMLAVYTFVFSVVFKARWGQGEGSKTEFALVLFAGIIVFNFFSECVSRAPGLIVSNPSYVKKVVFPIEILSVVDVGVAIFHAMISVVVWLMAYVLFFGTPHLTALLLPVVFLPLILFSLGLSWAVAALGVYIRDLSQMIGLVVTVAMFMSPVFYPASALPEDVRSYLFLNPVTIFVENF